MILGDFFNLINFHNSKNNNTYTHDGNIRKSWSDWMKVAIYLRVSSIEQASEGFSLAAQLKRLEAFCVSQNWKIQKIYREEGVSAKNMERPELQKLLNELNQFDVVLVYKLDRLSRSVIDVNKLLEQFEKDKVAFKCYRAL